MSSTHGTEHEARLAEALAGGDRRAVLDLLAGCEQCRGDWEALTRLGADLERAGRDFELDRTMPTDPGPRGEVAQAVAFAQSRERAPRRRFAPLAWWVAAVAATLALVLWFQSRSQPDDGGDLVLGVQLEALAPRGPVPNFELFEGRGERPSGGFFRISVFEPGAQDPLLVSPALDAPRWKPNAAELSKLPQRIEWRVESFVAGGESRVGSRVPAERP